jgi:hypothetical protein
VSPEDDVPENLRVSALHPGHVLFGSKASYVLLNRLLDQGHRVASVELGDGEGLEALGARYGETMVPFFAFDPRGRLHVFTETQRPKPAVGWTLIALVPPSPQDASPTRAPA